MYKWLENSWVEATLLLNVPSIGEDFAVLVRLLVRAGLEHLSDDVRAFPWR
jgi:hypothetical protein